MGLLQAIGGLCARSDDTSGQQQAVNLAHELDSGVLLSRDGDGHTAYSSGNTCIDDAVDAYLPAKLASIPKQPHPARPARARCKRRGG